MLFPLLVSQCRLCSASHTRGCAGARLRATCPHGATSDDRSTGSGPPYRVLITAISVLPVAVVSTTIPPSTLMAVTLRTIRHLTGRPD